MKHKSLLLILDGWGINPDANRNPIAAANPPYWNHLLQTYPNAALHCAESSVGLSAGTLPNSEVGHMAIGAGRVVAQTAFAIDRAIEDGSFFDNDKLVEIKKHLDNHDSTLHLYGLLSSAGIHAHINHLIALIEWAKQQGIKRVALHLCSDGRDMGPMEATTTVLPQLEKYLDDRVHIATLCGRVIAMDRAENWDRTVAAYNNLTRVSDVETQTPRQYLEANYAERIEDEFVAPARFSDAAIQDNDAVLFFDFRADRMRQMMKLFLGIAPGAVQKHIAVPHNLFLASIARYDDTFENVAVLFPPTVPTNTLSEWLSIQGLKQFRLAETEKYAHLTYFLNGGREVKFKNEERLMIPSLGLKDYSTNPELSLEEITKSLIRTLGREHFDFIACNIANADMVGHTGNFDAAKKAVHHVDNALARIIPVAETHGYTVTITADHGNIEYVGEHDTPHTAHTTSPVPLIITNPHITLPSSGELNQVAPTILDIFGLHKPKDMDSTSLIA